MTRRDYILIAETIRSLGPEVGRPVARVFADRLAKEDASFNREKFLKAALPNTPVLSG